LISLGIQALISNRTRASPGRLPPETGPFVRGLFLSHGKRHMHMENASCVPKSQVFLKQPNLLSCRELRRGEVTGLIKLLGCQCQQHGTLPVLWHMNWVTSGWRF